MDLQVDFLLLFCFWSLRLHSLLRIFSPKSWKNFIFPVCFLFPSAFITISYAKNVCCSIASSNKGLKNFSASCIVGSFTWELGYTYTLPMTGALCKCTEFTGIIWHRSPFHQWELEFATFSLATQKWWFWHAVFFGNFHEGDTFQTTSFIPTIKKKVTYLC